MKKLKSFLPFLYDATLKWFIDNDLKPLLLVDADLKGVIVPEKFVNTVEFENKIIKQIVLQIDPKAIQNYTKNENNVSFDTKFEGVEYSCILPYNAILGMFSEGIDFKPLAVIDNDAINEKMKQMNETDSNDDDDNNSKGSSGLKLV